MKDMDKKKIKIIALFGESGSGKDSVLRDLCKYWPEVLYRIINCTTRPIRDNEQKDVSYHFLTNEKFAEKVLNGEMIEATEFNNWFYGTSINDLNEEKINVGVFNLDGLEAILQDPRLLVKPVYIKTSPKERLIRAIKRENEPNCHEICRRFLADEKDFGELEDIEFSYNIFDNNQTREVDMVRYIESLGEIVDLLS